MKRTIVIVFMILSLCTLMIISLGGCKKTSNPIKFAKGTFPDSVINIEGLNSPYDDYNSTLYILGNTFPIIFSSNRGTSGQSYDLVQGAISFQFDQTSGAFQMSGQMTSNTFFTALLNKANTEGDDLGPYTLLSSDEGYEYLVVTSQDTAGILKLYYLKHLPYFGTYNPAISGPYPVRVLNTTGNDSYFSFNTRQDTAYFSSDIGGDFDIYFHKRTTGTVVDEWFNQDPESSEKVDSINSSYNDRCPFVYKNIMVFSSDRAGGIGGYDLYYSLFRNGKWSSPVNFGVKINTSENEFRPIVGSNTDFTNNFLIFSSTRTGGKGGYDLYFTGLTIGN